MALRVFFSFSFSDEDKPIVDFFRRVLEDCGLEVLTAEEEDSAYIIEKIYPKIDKSHFLISLFSARNKIGRKKYSPPSAVVFEAGYAQGQKKNVYGFREENVSLNELGLLRHTGGNYLEFARDKLDEKRREFKNFICSVPELKDTEITGSFDFNQYAKDVTIYRNGYGVVRFRAQIQTKSDKFRSIEHMLGLGGSAKKGLELPPFSELRKGDSSNRSKKKPFFSFRIIDANFTESDVKIQIKESSKEQIDFFLNFPKMTRNTVFQYEWAWGSPDLFPVTHKDLASGKRIEDLDYVLSELPNMVGGYNDFVFALRFEGFAEFIEIPVLKVYHSTGELITDKQFELQKSALYTNFIAKEVRVGILYGANIVARWIPK